MLFFSWLQEPSEASFVPESSEVSFVTAVSYAGPAASVVSELDYAGWDEEAEHQDDAQRHQVRIVIVNAHVVVSF